MKKNNQNGLLSLTYTSSIFVTEAVKYMKSDQVPVDIMNSIKIASSKLSKLLS